MSLLREGASGAAVRELQAVLTRLGAYAGPVDGRFGPATARAVRGFQDSRELAPDGVVGARTSAELRRVDAFRSAGAAQAKEAACAGARFSALVKEGLAQLGAVNLGNRFDDAPFRVDGAWERRFDERQDSEAVRGHAALSGDGPAARFVLRLETQSVRGRELRTATFADGRWQVTQGRAPHLLDVKSEAALRREVEGHALAAARAVWPGARDVQVSLADGALSRAALVEGVVSGVTFTAVVNGATRSGTLSLCYGDDGALRAGGGELFDGAHQLDAWLDFGPKGWARVDAQFV